MVDEGGVAAGRRAGAALVVLVVVAGFWAPVAKAVDDTRLVRTELVQSSADVQVSRFACLREAARSVPDRPTYVPSVDGLPHVEWYQRAMEVSFGEVPLVPTLEEAEQVLEVVIVADGSGDCGDVELQVRRP